MTRNLQCLVPGLVIAVALACGVPRPTTQKEATKAIVPPQLSPPRVHDPVLAKEGDTYYLFGTGRGITLQTSKDLNSWQKRGPILKPTPAWTATIPGSSDYYWAPDISYFGGKWHLYYSVSTFGSNHSAIGLATSSTLDSGKPGYVWKDEGLVIESKVGGDWNAIDPNLIIDAQNRPWLSFGSFWSGIKLVPLDVSTGKPSEPDLPFYSLASRLRDGESRGAIEAPFIVHRSDFYYLFVSFDLCCKGADSTYNIRVGRAAQITGPYRDRDGKPMMEGGGSLVRSSSARWKGPGHNAVYREGDRDFLVYHAYDAQDHGVSKLRIEALDWDAQGWPRVAETPQ